MTDGFGASVDLGITTEPTMSVEEATSRKAELFGSQEWRNKYFNGDIAARRDFDAITRALAPKPVEPSDPQSLDQIAERARAQADISDAVVEDIRQNRPVTPRERTLALERWERCLKDRAWMARYLDGGQAERREKLLLDVIISSNVRDQVGQ
jgi:hypothetical protein